MYQVTKIYGHDLGLSCCFRQHRATHSHCSKLHGYPLSFEFVFESKTLDSRNWVVDFGGLKKLKQRLVDLFDHKTAVAEDDPALDAFQVLHDQGIIDMVKMEGVGCELFAKRAFYEARLILSEYNTTYRNNVRLVSVKCSEHGANSATYIGKQ